MKAQINRKWRKKHPEQHKSYGEKRERTQKKVEQEQLEEEELEANLLAR